MRFETGVPLGEGGMGQVLKAWDPTLERHVALKLLRRDDPESVERMLREARTQARVDHPNVCKVYAVGSADGKPFIAMQLIDGVALDVAVSGRSCEEKARLVAVIAEAVQAAHEVGLIHRDLKPANVLVETRPDGELVPFVLDFGIAREHAVPGLTVSGQVVGTPGYMSPEQVRGEITGLDRRSDIFNLGIVLYELLSGRHPFDGGSAVDTMVRILGQEPLSLRQVTSGVARDLATIVETCLEKEPERRYASARALADDLRRFLAGEPIAARPLGRVTRQLRRLRRHPVATTAVTVALAAALAAGGLAIHARGRARVEAELAGAFGRRVERLDAMLRLAHLAPLHDLAAERAEVERELIVLRDEMSRRGAVAEAPGNLALGRAALALGRAEQARHHLQAAWDAGLRAPRVAFALGHALLSLHAERVARAEQLPLAEARRAAREEADRTLAAPARELVGAGLPDGSVAEHERLHLEALLALAAGDLATARERGSRASVRRGWFHDGLMVAAEAELRGGWDALGAGRREEASARIAAAHETAADAVSRAPSDPAAHRLVCRAHRLDMMRREAAAEPVDPAYRSALAACGAALTAAADDVETLGVLADVAWRMGSVATRRGEDPEPFLQRAESAVGRARALAPDDSGLGVLLGNVEAVRAERAADLGVDPLPAYARAVEHLAAAAARAPRDASVLLSLGHAHGRRASALATAGADAWEAAYAAALDAYQQGLGNPSGLAARLHSGICAMHSDLGYYRATRGEPPGEHYELAAAACRQALTLDPGYLAARNNLGMALWSQALHLAQQGRDAEPAFVGGAEALAAVLAVDPRRGSSNVNLAHLLVQHAEWRLAAGGDAAPLLAAAAPSLERVASVFPNDYRLVSAKARVAAAAVARDDGARATAVDALDEALALLSEYTAGDSDGPDHHLVRARALRNRGALRRASGRPAAARRDLLAARASAEHALRIAPENREALAELALALAAAAADGEPDDGSRSRARELAERAARGRPDLAARLAPLLARRSSSR